MPPLDVTLKSLIDILDDDLVEADPLTKVSEARQRARGLAELGDQLVDHYITAARADGSSWAQIGDAMGVSKQAAQQRKVSVQFNRYTPRARHVIVVAQEQARDWGSGVIDTEHLLLGVLAEVDGVGAKMLAILGGSIEAVSSAVTSSLTRGDQEPRGHIPFTDDAKAAITETTAAALDLGHNYIGTEHLVLGLLRAPQSKAATILNGLGITLDRAKDSIEAALAGYQHKPKQ